MWGGYKDKEYTEVWTEDTIANVFSVTKAMTATCALKLLEEKINLGDRVSRYWPSTITSQKDTTIKIFLIVLGCLGFKNLCHMNVGKIGT